MDAPALQLYRQDCAHNIPRVRGVGWVLRWAATWAVLALSAVILMTFAYQLAAERALMRAAAAGLREATLPRATSSSVTAVVREELAHQLDVPVAIELQLNGVPLKGSVHPQNGDKLSIAVSMPAYTAVPRWLAELVPWHERTAIATRLDRRFGQ